MRDETREGKYWISVARASEKTNDIGLRFNSQSAAQAAADGIVLRDGESAHVRYSFSKLEREVMDMIKLISDKKQEYPLLQMFDVIVRTAHGENPEHYAQETIRLLHRNIETMIGFSEK